MEFPVRCFTCGKIIGHMYEQYKKLVADGKSPKEAMDELGINRYCCRRMFITHVELEDEVIKYRKM
ncbi:MAG: DNA-directed RNA polymerase subunit N [Candidatus Anstonellales archaeon]